MAGQDRTTRASSSSLRAGGALDLAIRGGRIVTSGGSSETDLGIRGGEVVQIGGELPQAAREIDATGLLVLPGGIDMHVHLSPADHAPWRAADKLDPANTVAEVPPGLAELETLLPMLFSEGVRNGLIDLEARLFGLYPRKGTVAVGADADLLVWDPNAERVIRAEEQFTNSDYTPYEGRSITGWPQLTIRRGEILANSGRVLAPAGSGRRVRRQHAQLR
jgi:dihydroorotase-like cyclic amidohydrolase